MFENIAIENQTAQTVMLIYCLRTICCCVNFLAKFVLILH